PANSRQYQLRIRSLERAVRYAAVSQPGRGSWARCLRRTEGQRKRLCAAVEPELAENVWRRLERGGRLPGIETHPPGRTGREPEPTHRGTVENRITAHPADSESLLRRDPTQY